MCVKRVFTTANVAQGHEMLVAICDEHIFIGAENSNVPVYVPPGNFTTKVNYGTAEDISRSMADWANDSIIADDSHNITNLFYISDGGAKKYYGKFADRLRQFSYLKTEPSFVDFASMLIALDLVDVNQSIAINVMTAIYWLADMDMAVVGNQSGFVNTAIAMQKAYNTIHDRLQDTQRKYAFSLANCLKYGVDKAFIADAADAPKEDLTMSEDQPTMTETEGIPISSHLTEEQRKLALMDPKDPDFATAYWLTFWKDVFNEYNKLAEMRQKAESEDEQGDDQNV